MPKTSQHLRKNTDLTTVLEAFNALPIAFAIKNSALEYVNANEAFQRIVECPTNFKNDFDLFIPEIAYELSQEENQLLISETNQEIERILITKSGEKKIVKINRTAFYANGDKSPYISIVLEDVTQKAQNEQFDAIKKVFSKEDVFEKILNQFSNLIFRTSNRKEIFEGVCKLGINLLNLEDIAIYTVDNNNRLLQQAVYGKDEQLYYSEEGNIVLNPGEGICGLVAKQRESYLSNNLDQDPVYLPGIIKAKSEICVPIIYKNEVLGVIDSEASHYNFYSKDQLKQLESIASLLAIKLHELNHLDELENRDHILQAFVSQSPMNVVLMDRDLRIIVASKSWSDIFVDGQTKVIGKTLLELNPNFKKSELQKLEKVLNGKTFHINHQEYITPAGKHLWLSGKSSPWVENDEVIGVVSYVTDQTAEYERIRKLDQSKEELLEAQAHGKINNWSFDPNEGVFLWGSGMLSLKSMKYRENMPFEEVFDLIPDGYRQEFASAIQSAIQNKSTFEIIHPIQDDDRVLWLHNKGKVICNGNHISIIEGRARDITSEMDAENALREKIEELEKVNSQLDQFVYKTAHDLRAPLTNLAGLINVMKNVTDIDLLKTYLDLQEKSVMKLDNFILHIGTFTKNARLPIQVEEINMPGLIDEVLNDYLYVKNSDVVQKMVNVQRGVSYYTDKVRLMTILRNLVDNSIRFADLEKENPSIKIEVKLENERIVLIVNDNGIGVADNVIERVTEMFYRGTNLSEGAGIGLYIVDETVEKLSGTMAITSADKEGTTIRIELPNLALRETTK